MGVGDNIKQLREAKGISQRQLAREAGVSQPLLCQIERGTKNPSLPVGLALAAISRRTAILSPDRALRLNCAFHGILFLSPSDFRLGGHFCERYRNKAPMRAERGVAGRRE